MNRKETQGVLALLRAAYPNFYKGQTKEDLLAVVNLWQIQFADFACEDVIRAVHALIATRTEGFPPTIGAVKEQAAKHTLRGRGLGYGQQSCPQRPLPLPGGI